LAVFKYNLSRAVNSGSKLFLAAGLGGGSKRERRIRNLSELTRFKRVYN
jgi:hypothetical protein